MENLGDSLNIITEMLDVVEFGGVTNSLRVPSEFGELLQSFLEAFWGGFGEKEPILAGFNKIAGTALGVCNDWTTGGERFYRGDAKGFFARKEEGASVLEIVNKIFCSLPREESDILGIVSKSLKVGVLRTIADD